MRNALGAFGGLAGAIVVALVGRYGFVTSDTPIDGAITAFFFAVIAIGGISGPAVAVHLFRAARGWARAWGIVAGVIALVALLANLSNSLGAIAGRADKTTAERSNASNTVKDARAELKRLDGERAALPAFTPATADDALAAREAVTAAERASAAECGDGGPKQRGTRCLQREGEERAKRDALAAVWANKGLTDRVAKIDASEAAARRKLETVQPVGSVNPMAETLARIFHMQPDDAATWQQVATVIVVELLIAFALIAWELLTPKTGVRPAAEAISSQDHAERMPPAPVDSEKRPPIIGGVKMIDPPRLIADGTHTVGRFMLACLPRSDGEQVTWGAVYARYQRWCAEQDPQLVPLDLTAFGAQFAAMCGRVNIATRKKRNRVYCLDVRLG